MGIARKLAKLDHLVRGPIAQHFPPQLTTRLYSATRSTFLEQLAKERPDVDPPLHPVQMRNLYFRNDLGNAAGFDKDGKMLPFSYSVGAGFAVVGTVLIEPHTGNKLGSLSHNPFVPLPHSRSAINSLGLPSAGVDVVVQNIQHFRHAYDPQDFPIGASVMGHPNHEGAEKIAGTVECVSKLLPHVDFVEINESCPNTEHSDDGLTERIGRIVDVRNNHTRRGKYVPIFVKLGDFGNVDETIKFYSESGIDGLAGLNTQKDYETLRKDIDPRDRDLFDHYTENHRGGVSGAPIRGRAYQQIANAAEEIKQQGSDLKLIHIGGIATPADMRQSRRLGDTVVLREWYTGMMDAIATQKLEEIYARMVR